MKTQVKKRLFSLSMLLLVIGITVGLFVFARGHPEKVIELAGYGYLGAFLVSLVSSATVILPVPGILVVFPLVDSLNPVLAALAGATGGIIGELSGYMAGYSGRGMVQPGQMYNRVEGWMRKWGAWTIFVFAAAPFLLFDIAGVVAGGLRYPLWKFMLIGWVGKSLKFTGLMFAAIWGWEAALRLLGY